MTRQRRHCQTLNRCSGRRRPEPGTPCLLSAVGRACGPRRRSRQPSSWSQWITSARMNPRARSLWIAPAASTAVLPPRIVQARHSSGPTVKKESRRASLYDDLDHPRQPGLGDP